MSDERIERELREWMADAAPEDVPESLRLAVRDIPSTEPMPPRPRWILRFMAPPAAVVAAIAVMAIAVAGILSFKQLLPAAPSASPAGSMSAEPSTSLAPGVIAWIDARPSPGPEEPATPTPAPGTYPACSAADLGMAADGWEGATGSLAGGVVVVNVSSNTCSFGGIPGVDLLDANGDVIAPGRRPVRPASDQLIGLRPGGVAISGMTWMNWCGNPPEEPLEVRVTLPDGRATLTSTVHLATLSSPGNVPRCDVPSSGSGMGSGLFTLGEGGGGVAANHDCSTDDLVAFSGTGGAAAGTTWTPLAILKLTGYDCLLDAQPVLELRDGHADLLAKTPAATSGDRIPLHVGQAATAAVGIANWCLPQPAMPLSFDLIVGGRRLEVDSLATIGTEGCMEPGATPPPTFVWGGNLTVLGAPVPPPQDASNDLPFGVTVRQPLVATPGRAFTYEVTLRNQDPYDKPYNMAAWCPNYTERLILPGGRTLEEHHALNCADLGILQSGSSLTFEMRLEIPPDAPGGTAALVWILGDRGPGVKVDLEIR